TDPPLKGGELECRWLPKENTAPCGKIFPSRKDLIDHLNREHGVNGAAKRDIICRWFPPGASKTCGHSIRRSGFSRHLDVHRGSDVRFPCPLPGCGRSYSRRDVLNSHVKSRHGEHLAPR
ncbi:hypothetical protein ID866_6666, partial [Astraeus odoratus]